MCGIFGHTIPVGGFSLDASRAALHTLQHRGPDQWSDWHDNRIYIGHRRLSILDLSENGRQPMVSEDGAVGITVNGEIYNFAELRNSLKAKYRFRSGSDSEVVLHGYREWGMRALLEKIDGMYAIQVYDARTGTLHLARDRCGIKPLYYSTIGGMVAWASELKALVALHGSSTLERDYTALYDFLTYRYIPAPKTMYRGVHKLEPGTFLSLRLDAFEKPRLERYWDLVPKEHPISLEDARSEFRRILRKSVDEQMVADVPVGFFLSGGLDSSSVVACATGSGVDLRTYSIGFSEKKHDETEFASIVARQFGTDHSVKILDSSSTQGMFANLKTWYDEPFADLSTFPSYLVSSYAHESVKVVLTGDGGDEVCGGYNWYSFFNSRKAASRRSTHPLAAVTGLVKPVAPGPLRRALGYVERNWLYSDLQVLAKYLGGMVGPEKRRYAKAWGIMDDYDDLWLFRKHYREDLPLLTRLQLLDFHTFLPNDILTKVDRVTMAVSLEARVPLLSKDFIEFCFSLPEGIRFQRGELKGIMKSAMEEILPRDIIRREKKGFSIPNRAWKAEMTRQYDTDSQRILHELFLVPMP